MPTMMQPERCFRESLSNSVIPNHFRYCPLSEEYFMQVCDTRIIGINPTLIFMQLISIIPTRYLLLSSSSSSSHHDDNRYCLFTVNLVRTDVIRTTLETKGNNGYKVCRLLRVNMWSGRSLQTFRSNHIFSYIYIYIHTVIHVNGKGSYSDVNTCVWLSQLISERVWRKI
jgi:hypothetical protein